MVQIFLQARIAWMPVVIYRSYISRWCSFKSDLPTQQIPTWEKAMRKHLIWKTLTNCHMLRVRNRQDKTHNLAFVFFQLPCPTGEVSTCVFAPGRPSGHLYALLCLVWALLFFLWSETFFLYSCLVFPLSFVSRCCRLCSGLYKSVPACYTFALFSCV